MTEKRGAEQAGVFTGFNRNAAQALGALEKMFDNFSHFCLVVLLRNYTTG